MYNPSSTIKLGRLWNALGAAARLCHRNSRSRIPLRNEYLAAANRILRADQGSENGFKTGDGLPLTSPAVGYIRTAYGLKSRFDRLRERGMLTTLEIARRCGVSTNTIADWGRKGRIRALAINDRNQFLFEDPGPSRPNKGARKPAEG